MACHGSSKCTHLADYFVICGLDVSLGLEVEPPSDTAEDIQDNLTPLERPYKSRILAHYPNSVTWNPFDEKAVGMLCMPSGLTFCTEKKISGPKYHTFVVTKEDGSRYYGYALTFQEEVKDEGICRAIRTLQEMHLAEVTSRRRLYVKEATAYTSSLPRSIKIGSRKLTLAEDANDKAGLYDSSRDRLFVNKCLCYVSQHQFLAAFRALLHSLYARHTAPLPHLLPVESYIFNVLYEISTPSPGQSSRFYFYPESHFLLQRPSEDELPLFEYSLRTFFGLFGVEYAIDLMTCALLEHQILLCSKDHFLLMLVAECLTALLFPFTWQHVYVPILPESMQSFLDAPVPFIMGLHRRDLIRDIPRTDGNVCFVDIEGQKIRLPEDMPTFPDRGEFVKELREVIKCYGATLNTDFLQHRIHHKNRALPRKFSLTDLTEAASFKEIRQNFERDASPVPPSFSRGALTVRNVPVLPDEMSSSPKKVSRGFGGGGAPNTAYMIPYIDDLRFNNAIREVFLNRFVQMFYSYDHFVLQSDAADYNRDNVHTFDKATFLSDQPDTHIPFLSPFLETQMFASFIDSDIAALHDSENLTLAQAAFHSRLDKLKDQMGESLVRADEIRYQPCSTIDTTEQTLMQRLKSLDLSSPEPRKLPDMKKINTNDANKEFLPLDGKILNPESQPVLRPSVNMKKKEAILLRNSSPAKVGDQRRGRTGQRIIVPKPSVVAEPVSSMMVTENWNFVDDLLKECKLRTKKMLVEKLKQEAVDLGHNEDYVTGVEENTQIASLCDLLERVWSHGLHTKQGKSSLWSHLLYYQQRHEDLDNIKAQTRTVAPEPASPLRSVSRSRMMDVTGLANLSRLRLFVGKSSNDLTSLSVDFSGSGEEIRGRSSGQSSGMDLQPPSLIFDMKNVLAMPEIRSALGYARAWVRLSLEKKLLAKHLRALLADSHLLETLYKRYAFLRNEDEREQFVFHLLSLNAVDFYCFTNTFVNTLVPYRVIFFPSRKYTSSMPSTFWFCLGGALGDSGNVTATKSNLQMLFQRKNLGLLTTLRIGLEKNMVNTKCLIEYILVRNEVTGNLAKFSCGRWLGRGVDDGSIERLLVVEQASPTLDSHVSAVGDHFSTSTLPRTPQRCRSPSANRRSTDGRFTVSEIEQMLGNAANSIVKYFYKPEKERGSMTVLMCGEMGMVFSLEQALLYGYSPLRLTRQAFVWNIFEKCDNFFRTELLGEKRMPPLRREDIKHFCRTIRHINSSNSLGKDGKFQLFAAVSLRDRCLDKWLELVRSCPIVDSVYDRNSFIRDLQLFQFLMEILNSLKDFRIVLEPSFIREQAK